MDPAAAVPINELLGPDDLVRDLGRLPSSPAVLPQLMSLLNESSTALHEVVGLILLDAGIAARVLQVANSAYYGRGIRCEAVDEAVYRIGFLKTYEMVSFAVASRLLIRPLETYGMPAEELWRRSIAGAVAAEVLARRCDLNSNLAYTAGLFHDVGLVAIDTWARNRDTVTRIHSSGYPAETTPCEISVLGFTNASVAAALLRSWKFADVLVEPIRWQFKPAEASTRHQPIACVLSVARWLRDAIAPPAGVPLPRSPDVRAMQLLNQSPAEIASLIEETRQAFARATLILGDMGGGADPLLLRTA
jgi:HD-like signal output (HDOD) protein